MPEHHLQDIIKNAPIGVFTSTPEGRYTSANPALARMFGYESPEALIASITDIATQVYADPADREAFMRLMAEHGEAVDYECRFKRKDGTEFWVSRNVREIRDEDGRVVAYQGFSTDITERKQAEEAWRGSEERYRNVAEANAGMVWDLDANLTVTHVSGRVYEILGYEPEAIIGRNPLFPVDPEDRERISAVMARMLRQQEPVKDIEYWCRHSDGGRVRILTNGVPFFAKDGGLLGFRGTHIDMTETYWARRCRKITLQLHKMINESDNAISAALCEACSEVTDSTMAFFGMLEPDESAMIAHVWSPAAMAECRIADKPLRFPIETAGLWAEPIRRKQPVILNDYPNAPEKGGLPEGHVPITRYLGVPILHGDKVVAVVGAANRAPGYEERHIDRLRMITSTIADILLLRRNEEAMRDQSQLLHNIIDTAADLLSVTDLEGNFKFVGPSHGILGYDPDSLVGRNVMEFVHPDDYPETATAFADFLANREDGRKVEYRYRRADGDYFWFETIGKFIRDDAGNPKEILFSTRNVTARKQAEGQLKRIEWMLSRKPVSDIEARTEAHDQGYSDLTELNRNGIILKSIGHELLKSFSNDYLELLETSSAIYEENGDYAFGIFTSGWCRMMDRASRNLCDTPDNAEALNSGRWLCHESCWTDCSKQAIAKRIPMDIECHGGLRIYAIPIFAGENVVGAINFGYGDPPTDEEQLRKLAETYHLDYEDLVREADAYDSRPPFIIEVAKKRLHSTARIIGSMIETKQTEEALRKSEETLRTTLHSIGDAVISTDMDGLIAAMNPVAESLTGWSEEEATGQALETVFRIINEQTRRPVESPVANVLRSDHIVGLANHTLLIAKDGREIPIADSGAPIRNDAGGITGVVLVFRDQTEERAAREALEASEATIRNKLKAITEPGGDIGTLSLGDIIDSEELQNMIEDLFKISKVGGAILDISGKVLVSVKMEDICGKFHRVHPETAKNCLESDLALANGVPAGTFKAYRCKNNMWDMVSPIIIGGKHLGNIYIGQFFYDDERVDYESFRKQARRYGFDETEYLAALDRVPRLKRETVESAMTFYAKLAGMISSLSYSKIKLSRDIVRRKRAEEALRESETRFQKMLGVVPDMISIQNPEMDILYSNWQGLAAVPDNRRILHTKCHKTYQNFDNICPDCLATSVLENRTPVHEETRLPDGKWYDIRVIPILDKDNNVEMFMEWVRDITESKQAEEALRSNYALLQIAGDTARFGGWSVDLEKDIATWSDAVADIHEMPRGYAPPVREAINFYAPGWRDKIIRVFNDCAQKGIPYDEEMEIITSKGKRVWVRTNARAVKDETGRISKVRGSFQDITEHKRAVDALRESEEKHRRLFETMAQGVVYHAADGTILSANPAAERILGLSFDQMQDRLSMDPRWGIVNEDGTEVPGMDYPAMIPLRTGETFGPAIRGVSHPDKNAHVWLSITAIPLFQPGETKPFQVYTTFEDITEHKRAVEALREREAFIKATLDKLPVGVAVNSVDPEVHFTYMNDNFAKFYRTTREALAAPNDFWEVVYKDPVFREEIKKRVLEDCASNDLERMYWEDVPVSRPGQEPFYITAKNIPLPESRLMVSTVWDVTERKQAEKDIIESEARFKALHNASFGGIAIHDQGVILECNQGLTEITGFGYDELIGMDGLLLIAEKFREAVMNNIRSGYEKPYEVFGVRKDGEEYPLRLEARNIPYKGKRVRVVEFRDITDLKRAEEEREKLQGQLTQAQKMESVGRLAGGVAHDFNNMLGVILGHAEMVMDQVNPSQPLFSDLEEIRKAAERSAILTRQLLTFARKQTIAPKVIDLNETVEGMLKMLRRLIGEDIDLSWRPGKNLRPVKMDPSQIDQILANLCVNARDAIADVGKITIETGTAAFDEAYCADHAGFIPGEFIMLAVSDNGCGMDKETVSHLFEPFFTTKDVGKGTGLGLATVYGAVKQNKGFINVYSEPGQGTTFRIYLPPYQAGTRVRADTATPKPAARGSETILLVEDEPANLHMVTMMLEKLGYDVIAAETPGEAIRLAHEHAGSIDLLMTDVVMPEMNGRDLAKNILPIYPDIKRLFMSGYTANVIAHHGVLDEGVHFIQKPFSSKDLGAKLRDVLES